MRKILGIITLVLPLGLLTCNQKPQPLVIKKVIDGDTVYFQAGQIGRIFGIDTPELKNKYGAKTKGVERLMALKAKRKLRALLFNQQVKVIKVAVDKYNRWIIKLQANNFDFGTAMVKLGLARVAYITNKPRAKFFSKDEDYYKRLLEAQHYAYKNAIGVWSRSDLYKKIFPVKI